MTTQSIISIQNLNHFFGEKVLRKQVLFDINLEIQPAEFVVLTGPSGSGKSTLLSLVGCLRSVHFGSLQVLGQELNGADNEKLIEVRRNFGYITQSSNLLHFLTAQQNVQMSLELHSKISRRERRRRAKAILEAVGLGEHLNAYPENLSGGQRQRVAIASALVTSPKLILADEPTAALDRKSGRHVVSLMHRLAKEQGSAVLMVTHDNRILDLADRIINVEDGTLGLAVAQELSLAFPGFDATLLDKSDTHPIVLNYAAGEAIIRQGDVATKFYILLKGEVEVFREMLDRAPKFVRRMGRGEYFGEIGLLKKQRRTATIRVAPDSQAKVMEIDEAFFRILMAKSELTKINVVHRLNQRMIMDRLAVAFPNISPARLSDVLEKAEIVRYGPNSKIVQAGEIADKFYLIWKGQVTVLTDGSKGEDAMLRTMQSGEYFGACEMLNDKQFEVTIQTPPDTTVDMMILDQSDFHRLIAGKTMVQDDSPDSICLSLTETPTGSPQAA